VLFQSQQFIALIAVVGFAVVALITYSFFSSSDEERKAELSRSTRQKSNYGDGQRGSGINRGIAISGRKKQKKQGKSSFQPRKADEEPVMKRAKHKKEEDDPLRAPETPIEMPKKSKKKNKKKAKDGDKSEEKEPTPNVSKVQLTAGEAQLGARAQQAVAPGQAAPAGVPRTIRQDGFDLFKRNNQVVLPPDSSADAGGGPHPPYMKGMLRPSRSDPSLISSYDDVFAVINKPLYNHMQTLYDTAMQQGGMRTLPGSPGGPAGAESGPVSPLQPSMSGSLEAMLNPTLLAEVCKLDLFDHPTVAFKVADLGNACWVTKHFSDDIQTRQYRSPETIINAGYDTSADIWSLACMIFELVTGDYLFDPKASEEYPRDEDHLALFVELLGPIPPKLASRSRRAFTYFNRKYELRHIKSLRYWGLEDVLQQKYHMHPVEAKSLASFLLPMLRLNPEERSTANAMLTHPWLQGLPSTEAMDLDMRSSLAAGQPSAVADGQPPEEWKGHRAR